MKRVRRQLYFSYGDGLIFNVIQIEINIVIMFCNIVFFYNLFTTSMKSCCLIGLRTKFLSLI